MNTVSNLIPSNTHFQCSGVGVLSGKISAVPVVGALASLAALVSIVGIGIISSFYSEYDAPVFVQNYKKMEQESTNCDILNVASFHFMNMVTLGGYSLINQYISKAPRLGVLFDVAKPPAPIQPYPSASSCTASGCFELDSEY